MIMTHTNTITDTISTVLSKDGTTISYLSVGGGQPVIVIPGALSMAAGYAANAICSLPLVPVAFGVERGAATLVMSHARTVQPDAPSAPAP